jgi:AraC-like DNA-binding protein
MLSGFASTSYFAKIFREREGVPPSEYRSINRYIQL